MDDALGKRIKELRDIQYEHSVEITKLKEENRELRAQVVEFKEASRLKATWMFELMDERDRLKEQVAALTELNKQCADALATVAAFLEVMAEQEVVDA